MRTKKHIARRTKATCATQKDLSRFAHQIANQLTVINLSCFKLRCAAGDVLPLSVLENIERVEKAVAEVTSLVQALHLAENPTHTSDLCLRDSLQDR